MKVNMLYCFVLAGLLVPGVLRAAEGDASNAEPGREQMRERFRDLSPEEREARIREFRERQGGMMAGPLARVFMVLTPQQRESLRDLAEKNRDQVRGLEEKLRDARKAVMDASLERPFNEAALRDKLIAVSRLETELALIRAATLAKVEPPLTDKQIAEIKNPPSPGGMGRGRGMQQSPGDQKPPSGSEPHGNGLPPRAE